MKCGEECEIYSRIVGYFRPVEKWNSGKKEEFKDRLAYSEEPKHKKPKHKNVIVCFGDGQNIISADTHLGVVRKMMKSNPFTANADVMDYMRSILFYQLGEVVNSSYKVPAAKYFLKKLEQHGELNFVRAA